MSGEEDSNPTAFTKATQPILEHFAKRAATYISAILVTAVTTATTEIISLHNSGNAKTQAKAEVKADTSYLGDSWVGSNLLAANTEIWESRAMILDLRSNVAVLQQRLDSQPTNKTNHEN